MALARKRFCQGWRIALRWTYEYVAEIAPDLTMDTDGDGSSDSWGFT